MIDPSSTCGYPLEEQISLAKELKSIFKDVPIIYVINKIDLSDHESIEKAKEEIGGVIFCTIASEGEGIKEAVSGALKLIDFSLKLP